MESDDEDADDDDDDEEEEDLVRIVVVWCWPILGEKAPAPLASNAAVTIPAQNFMVFLLLLCINRRLFGREERWVVVDGALRRQVQQQEVESHASKGKGTTMHHSGAGWMVWKNSFLLRTSTKIR